MCVCNTREIPHGFPRYAPLEKIQTDIRGLARTPRPQLLWPGCSKWAQLPFLKYISPSILFSSNHFIVVKFVDVHICCVLPFIPLCFARATYSRVYGWYYGY